MRLPVLLKKYVGRRELRVLPGIQLGTTTQSPSAYPARVSGSNDDPARSPAWTREASARQCLQRHRMTTASNWRSAPRQLSPQSIRDNCVRLKCKLTYHAREERRTPTPRLRKRDVQLASDDLDRTPASRRRIPDEDVGDGRGSILRNSKLSRNRCSTIHIASADPINRWNFCHSAIESCTYEVGLFLIR